LIPEPQRTYVLELMAALGPAAAEFVIAGAQAIKFAVNDARGTKDVDFILDVVAVRARPLQLNALLKQLGYVVVAGARNFQFEKPVPLSAETMRIEFMAPEEFKRSTDFRVDIQEGIHARACTGGTIAIAESDDYPLEGTLPDGKPYATKVRVTRSHALVMLKLLALYDRYHNIRGPLESRHDREEAQTHAADIVAIVKNQPDLAVFRRHFDQQFQRDTDLASRVNRILLDFFRDAVAPGYLLYEEYLASALPAGRVTRTEIREESARTHRILQHILPKPSP
jgi:hypothetical protein